MTEASTPPAPTPHVQNAWYIQAADKVWGPYAEGRLAGFLAEKRLTAQSLVATQPAGPFGPAGRRRELKALFDPAAPTEPSAARAEASVASAGADPDSATRPRALLVWADLASLTPAAFEAALSGCGAFVSVRAGVWLVQAAMGASALRNRLSRELDGRDTLIVVEAPLDHAAWFNLDQAAERSLRTLWSGSGP